MNLNQLTIKEAEKRLRGKVFSCFELLKSCLNEIKKKDKEINAFITLNENALNEAKEIDKKILKKEKIGKLAGIPIAVKDNILVEELRCTAGSKILENYIAPFDATVIEKLKKEGAIIIGKTNLDEFAMGSSGEYSAFGPTRNPHHLSYVAGGSSSGSAAAVAANFCLGALGSDTGGSIRLPSAFCGVVGLKPSYGSVSRYGLIAMASSLDQIGPIVKTVEDAEIIFNIIKGKDELDSTTIDLNFKTEKANLKKIQNFKIGLPKEYFTKGLNEEIKGKIDEIIKKLENQGIKIKEVSLPHTEYALACYYLIMSSEVSANLARYDAIRYGKVKVEEKKIKNINDWYLEVRTKYFGEEVKRRIMLGTYTLSAGYYEAYYLKAQKVRNLIKKDFENVFKEVDLLITPTTPTTAFRLNEKQTPLEMYLSDIFTVAVNLAGLPAINLPIGFAKNNLPIGCQIIGNYLKEDEIFELGKIIEKIR
jgi:aspartyl-tRNA(Asn)/glutamyl-tRNA(Gln) amidotransferase subunit A